MNQWFTPGNCWLQILDKRIGYENVANNFGNVHCTNCYHASHLKLGMIDNLWRSVNVNLNQLLLKG